VPTVELGADTALAMAAARATVMELGSAMALAMAARATVMGLGAAMALAAMGTAGVEKVLMGMDLTVTPTVMAVMAIMEDTTATVSPVITAILARVLSLAEDRVMVMGLGAAKAQNQGADRFLIVAARPGAAVVQDQRVQLGLFRELAVVHRVQVLAMV
jgi:hypothetical protein